jgi:putative ABC transport system permease protein
MGLTDIRHAIRLLGRSPIFTVTSIASLAIGIGASTAIFSLADALMLRPTAGVRDAQAIVDIGRSDNGSGFDNMSHPTYQYLSDHTTTLSSMSALEFGGSPMSLSENGGSQRVTGVLVSGSFFDVLGTRPAIGRFFRPDEDAVPGERPVVVLSHGFWQRHFNGDPDILEKPIRLNNQVFSVVGVSEAGFDGLTFIGTDLWVPMAMVATVRGRNDAGLLDEPGSSWHMAVGRLKPGVSAAQAQAELNTLINAFKAAEPRVPRHHQIAVAPTSRVPAPVRLAFLAFIGLLFALTAALMAIACSNVAGMLLARSASRRREMATRLAIGASRGRLIAQLLTETLVLFVAAGAVAIPITMWLMNGLASFLPSLPVDIHLDLSVNPRVIAFAFGMALVTAVVFGLAPARQAMSTDLAASLHGAYATVDRRRFRLRNSLVIGQVALSLMLVVTASLFVRTLQNVSHVNPGYTFANVELASIDVSVSGYREQTAVDLVDRFQERLRGINGVTAVSTANQIPLQGSALGLGRIRVAGYQGPRGDGTVEANWNVVSPGFFDVVGTRLVEGRDFQPADRSSTVMVAIVNETFAKTAFPGRTAVGQEFMQETRRDQQRPIEIVGVVADAKYRYFSDPAVPFVFVPMSQQPLANVTLFVKHGGRPIGNEIRAAVAQVEATVPVIVLQSFEDATSIGLIPQQLAAWTAGSVGSIGVFLAALGLYGLMAFVVAQRTREIAIRMALGASDHDMRSMVLKQAARLSVSGAAIGLLLAGAIGMLVQSLLVGVPAIDPLSFGGTALLFAVVLAGACWTPASRAAATDPAVALRAE